MEAQYLSRSMVQPMHGGRASQPLLTGSSNANNLHIGSPMAVSAHATRRCQIARRLRAGCVALPGGTGRGVGDNAVEVAATFGVARQALSNRLRAQHAGGEPRVRQHGCPAARQVFQRPTDGLRLAGRHAARIQSKSQKSLAWGIRLSGRGHGGVAVLVKQQRNR